MIVIIEHLIKFEQNNIMKKKTLVETFERLPDEFQLDELIEQLIVLEKIEKGRADGREGKVLTDEEAKQRLSKWLK